MNRRCIAVLLIAALCGCAGSSRETKSSAEKHTILMPNQLKWEPAPPSLPPGAQIAVLEGDMPKPGFFAVRARFPAGYRIAPHWHPGWERVTVLSGTFYLGDGEKFDESAATEMRAGTYTSMSPGMRHFAYTKGAAEIQLATNGPWGIHYVNDADDPRKQASKSAQ